MRHLASWLGLLAVLALVAQPMQAQTASCEMTASMVFNCSDTVFDLSAFTNPRQAKTWTITTSLAIYYIKTWNNGIERGDTLCDDLPQKTSVARAVSTSCTAMSQISNGPASFDPSTDQLVFNQTAITNIQASFIFVCEPDASPLTTKDFTVLSESISNVVFQVGIPGVCLPTTTASPSTTTTTTSGAGNNTTTAIPSTTTTTTTDTPNSGNTTTAPSTSTTTTSGAGNNTTTPATPPTTATPTTNDGNTTTTAPETTTPTAGNATTTAPGPTNTTTTAGPSTSSLQEKPLVYPIFEPCIAMDFDFINVTTDTASKQWKRVDMISLAEQSYCGNLSTSDAPQAQLAFAAGIHDVFAFEFQGHVVDGVVTTWELIAIEANVTLDVLPVVKRLERSQSPNGDQWPAAEHGYGYACPAELDFATDFDFFSLHVNIFQAQPFNLKGDAIAPAPDQGLDTCLGTTPSPEPSSTTTPSGGNSTTTPSAVPTTPSGGNSTTTPSAVPTTPSGGNSTTTVDTTTSTIPGGNGTTTIPHGNTTTTTLPTTSSTTAPSTSTTTRTTTTTPATTPADEGPVLIFATNGQPCLLVDFSSIAIRMPSPDGSTLSATVHHHKGQSDFVVVPSQSLCGSSTQPYSQIAFRYLPSPDSADDEATVRALDITLSFVASVKKDVVTTWDTAGFEFTAQLGSVTFSGSLNVANASDSKAWPSAAEGYGYACGQDVAFSSSSSNDGFGVTFEGLMLQPFNVVNTSIVPAAGQEFDECASGSRKKRKSHTTVIVVVVLLLVVAVGAVVGTYIHRRRRGAYESLAG
ncbi:uncharacterized protein MONBRDRAFT_31662 [Monosiga brevicollis MX1]|uniref:Uncharacterized protein n=1 Tax=Monosiga brevicollis TaxID=81824 RepID=A9UV02_MONBE|nr:uncharacterized protein MONBRDRAFT_31662 [Monosiga brevicollis MX1]EDQ91001.1 predicted protein [Monosiga brevicollis MX1]|eukprot:XP_001744298.1 hypothetical protein [Monosiga brevicollis MX1]